MPLIATTDRSWHRDLLWSNHKYARPYTDQWAIINLLLLLAAMRRSSLGGVRRKVNNIYYCQLDSKNRSAAIGQNRTGNAKYADHIHPDSDINTDSKFGVSC